VIRLVAMKVETMSPVAEVVEAAVTNISSRRV
jgi:hypothetical protein